MTDAETLREIKNMIHENKRRKEKVLANLPCTEGAFSGLAKTLGLHALDADLVRILEEKFPNP